MINIILITSQATKFLALQIRSLTINKIFKKIKIVKLIINYNRL